MVIKADFRAVKKAGDDAMQHALREGTDVMHHEAMTSIGKGAEARGYNLDPGDIESEVSETDGRIWHREFWARYFEYGTVFIKAVPFMRPAHRKGRKAVVDDLGDNLEKFVRRRVRL